jgi:hypothetical protein
MDQLLATYLGRPLPLKDQAVIQLGGYDLDYFEYEQADLQILIYRSHKDPVATKVIISQGPQVFNLTLPQDQISLSHFLEYYEGQAQLTDQQLGLVADGLERVKAVWREPSTLATSAQAQVLRDYQILTKLIDRYQNSPVVQVYLALHIHNPQASLAGKAPGGS